MTDENSASNPVVQPGDLVILITYCHLSDDQARNHAMKVVFVDAANRPVADGVARHDDGE